MPGTLLPNAPFKTITITPLHPTFGAEVNGADFLNMSDLQLSEIKSAMAKYGVVVFRNTKMDDSAHVSFSTRIGPLDNVRRYLTAGRKLRYQHYELFDAGNVDAETGAAIDPSSQRAHYNKGNALFHVDSSFNPRRASWSLLRAVKLPPPGMGGATEFADSRTAWDELDAEVKEKLLREDYIGAHTLLHSRKRGSPEFFKDLDPISQQPMMRHKVVQIHEPSGRTNLYLGAHCHHLEKASEEMVPEAESREMLDLLEKHITQPKYVLSVDWENEGDVVVWDNTCVQHRATGGSYEGKFVRDMRRTTVHDGSATAWGLNDGLEARGFDTQNLEKVGKAGTVS